MIMSKNDDGTYSQVGFIKDNSGADIEYIKDKDGVILFEKGFAREKSGALPLQLDGIGKPLKDYNIKGNIYQAENVSPDIPQEVVGCGDRTGNLFKFSATEQNGTNGFIKCNEGESKFYITKSIMSSDISRNLSLNIKLAAGTYTLSVKGLTPYNQEYDRIYLKKSDGENIALGTQTEDPKTFTLTEETIISKMYCIMHAETVYENTEVCVMLNTGTTPEPYEPYGYKIPVVTRGKNLANISTENWKFQNANTTAGVADNKITITGSWFAYIVVPVTANTNYTFQYVCESYTKKNLAAVFGVKNGVMNTSDPIIANAPSGKTFNTGERTEVALLFYASDSSETGTSVYSNIQLELDSTVTSYEPYHEPITTQIYLDSPLYKIGDYADRLEYKGKLCERNVRELVLTGEENWQIYSVNKVHQFYTDLPTDKHSTSGLSAYSNIAGYGATANNRNEYEFGCYPVTTGTQIALQMLGAKEQFAGISTWKTYLKEQYAAGTPVKVWYVLQTPESESEELPEIPTLAKTTVIEAETTVQPSEMHIKYKSRT